MTAFDMNFKYADTTTSLDKNLFNPVLPFYSNIVLCEDLLIIFES